MQCDLTLIIPFGETDPTDILIRDHSEMKVGIEDAAQIIAHYTNGNGIGYVPFISPCSLVGFSADFGTDDGLIESSEAMICAWPAITINAFNVAADNQILVVEDGDFLVHEFGPNLAQLAEQALWAQEFLRIAIRIDSQRRPAFVSPEVIEFYDLWETINHPAGGLGLLVQNYLTGEFIIQPITIECTSFVPPMAA